jgi:hypothetical protein
LPSLTYPPYKTLAGGSFSASKPYDFSRRGLWQAGLNPLQGEPPQGEPFLRGGLASEVILRNGVTKNLPVAPPTRPFATLRVTYRRFTFRAKLQEAKGKIFQEWLLYCSPL